MKFLQAKDQPKPKGEHKMRSGIRTGQTDPQDLRGGQLTTDPRKIRTASEAKDQPNSNIIELAEKLGVDLETLKGKGSGQNGEILVRDVREAAKAKGNE